MNAVAAARGESPAQVALAWVLSKPEVTAPIIGVSRLAQIDDPLKAVKTELSQEEIGWLEAPYEHQPVIGALRRDQGLPRFPAPRKTN